MYAFPHHQPPHSLLLNALILFFLFTLRVGMVSGHSFGKLLELSCHGAMVLLKILCMLEDTVEIFLEKKKKINKEGLCCMFSREFRFENQFLIVNKTE